MNSDHETHLSSINDEIKNDSFSVLLFPPDQVASILERFNPSYELPPNPKGINPPIGTIAPTALEGLGLEYLWRLSWYHIHHYDKALKEGHNVFLALDNNDVVGFCDLDNIVYEDGEEGMIVSFIYIEQKHRRKGLAKKLVRESIDKFGKVSLSGPISTGGQGLFDSVERDFRSEGVWFHK